MSQLGWAECEGAPRDLGFDQGRALRDEIRADLRALGWEPARGPISRWRARGRPAAFDASFARALAHHFPHLDERVAGLADGAGCRRDWVSALATRELATALAADVRRDAVGLELRWREPLPPTGLVVRHTRPDGGYANLAVTRPGVVCAVGGVNEHGLAAALQIERPVRAGDPCHAPGALLLEQCIERLDGVEKALEWCERRPGGGGATLVFADASGASGAITLDGAKRARVVAPVAPLDGAGPTVRIDSAARTIEVAGGGIASRRFALASGA
jgi:hypothetical protein